MKLKLALVGTATVAAALLAGPASAAVTFFSVGAAGPGIDPGAQPYETIRFDFNTDPLGPYTGPSTGTAAIYNTTSGVAARPAGDTSNYLALGGDGSATFSIGSLGGTSITSISAYLGSIDSYNYIDILTSNPNSPMACCG